MLVFIYLILKRFIKIKRNGEEYTEDDFHIPMRINRERASASSIRPVKMIEAFERLGYEVILIEGNASQRKKRIKEIKHNY